MKKPHVAFSIADAQNKPYADMLLKTIRKFHTEEELPFVLIEGEDLKKRLADDSHFFYRATPVIAGELMSEYETVIKLDADQLVLGKLNYLWECDDFEVGTVLNVNRVDPARYGYVTVQGVAPQKYYNNGLVVLKSEKFVEHWRQKCFSDSFFQLQYREQDILNILCHFGQYSVRCLDYYDLVRNSNNWWGLVSKGEWSKAILQDGHVVIPKGKDSYPDRDVMLKVIHWAGGGNEQKMNYKVHFSEAVSEYISSLLK